ncbi:HutD family protein [Gordonia sp. NB41Y]|uniref:HutD/Ves family protein n=1 Tax=Gordonia sp. NB41Y TaxID=875808 RepID=UPI0002BE6F22|nr:HutD family protein [Gordonia sp. NB41Y]WLP92433.1 HutD family protein [Gordonia sp. NB41Y]
MSTRTPHRDGHVPRSGVIRGADVPLQPWRNGAGVTRRIATGGSTTAPDWTLSIAEIEAAGDFSRFDGFERTALILGADPVMLTVDGTDHHLVHLDRIHFSGDDEVAGEPTHGTTQILNLMVRRTFGRSDLTLQNVRGSVELSAEGTVAYLVLSGSLRTADDALEPLDTILVGSKAVTVHGTGTVARVHLHPTAASED